jgi:hypothetical protein
MRSARLSASSGPSGRAAGPCSEGAASATTFACVKVCSPIELSAILLAHAGHWLLNLAYVMPVIIVLAVAITAMIRERRECGHERDEAAEDEELRRG